MEESVTRKRHVEISPPTYKQDKEKLKIHEEVLLISFLRPDIPRICDSLSISVRVAALAELAFLDRIDICDNVVKIKEGIIADPILSEIHSKIRGTETNLRDLLISLNGESFTRSKFKLHIKKMRERLSRNLEDKGIIRYGKNKYKILKGRVYVDEKTKNLITTRIIDYLCDKSFCLRTEVLIGCLIYCNSIKPLLFSLPQNKLECVTAKIERIKKGFTDSTVKTDFPERFIYVLLRTLFKL